MFFLNFKEITSPKSLVNVLYCHRWDIKLAQLLPHNAFPFVLLNYDPVFLTCYMMMQTCSTEAQNRV